MQVTERASVNGPILVGGADRVQGMGQKQCRACKRVGPNAEFRKDKRSEDGLSARCRACQNKYQREWSKRGVVVTRTKARIADRISAASNAAMLSLANGDSKTCRMCSLEKSCAEFPLAPKGIERKGGFMPNCKACLDAITEKKCALCRSVKPMSAFARSKGTNDGRVHRCRECWADNHKSRRTDPVRGPAMVRRARELHLMQTYGITDSAYQAMEMSQKGLCGVCARPETERLFGKPRKLSVDHDHKTGAVRTLLCNRCNVLLGCADDDIALLEAAIRYLTRFGNQREEQLDVSA